jgi:hypothetical protein
MPVLFLVTACGAMHEEFQRMAVLTVSVMSSVPASRDTFDRCAIDLAFTNPYAHRVRVILDVPRIRSRWGMNCLNFASGAWFRRSSTWCSPEKGRRESRAPPWRGSRYTT